MTKVLEALAEAQLPGEKTPAVNMWKTTEYSNPTAEILSGPYSVSVSAACAVRVKGFTFTLTLY